MSGCAQCRRLGVPCPECRILDNIAAPPSVLATIAFIRARQAAAVGYAATRRAIAAAADDQAVAAKHRIAAKAYDADARWFDAAATALEQQAHEIETLTRKLAESPS